MSFTPRGPIPKHNVSNIAQFHDPEVPPLQIGQVSGRKRKAPNDQYQRSSRSHNFRNAPHASRMDEYSYPENFTADARNDAPQSPFGMASNTEYLSLPPVNVYHADPDSLEGGQDTIQGSSHDHYLPPDFFGLGSAYEAAPEDGYEAQTDLEVEPDDAYLPGNAYDATPESAYEDQNDLETLDDDDEYEPGSAYEPDQESFDEEWTESDFPLGASAAHGGYEAGPSTFREDELPSNEYDSSRDTLPSTRRVSPARNRSAHTASRTKASNQNSRRTPVATHVNPILFQLEPPPEYGLDALVPLRNSSGKAIVDEKGREYKSFPGLPRRMPVRLDDHTLLLYTDRTDPRIQHRDLAVRMTPRPGENIPRENAMNMQRSRYRNKHNLACWTRKTKLPSLRDCLLMEVIDPASVDHNTISRISERGIEVAMAGVGRLPLDIFAGDGQVHVASRDLGNVFHQITRLQAAAERENVPHWIFLPNKLKPKEWMKKAVAAKRKKTNNVPAVKRDHAEDIIFPVELPAASLDWIKRCVTDAAEYEYPVPRLSSLPPHICAWMRECIREGQYRARRKKMQSRNLNGKVSHSTQRSEQNDIASQGSRTRTQQRLPDLSMNSGHNGVRLRADAEYPTRTLETLTGRLPQNLGGPSNFGYSGNGKKRLRQPMPSTYSSFEPVDMVAPEGHDQYERSTMMANPGPSSRHQQLNYTERNRPTQSQNWKGQSQETTNQFPGMASSSKRKRSTEDADDHEQSKRAKLAQQELDRFKAVQASRPSRNGKNPARPYGPTPAQHPPPIRSYKTATDTNGTVDYQMNTYTQDPQSHPVPMAEWPSYQPMTRVEPQHDTDALDNEDYVDYDASDLTPRAHQPTIETFPNDPQENNMYGNEVFEGFEQDGEFEMDPEYEREQSQTTDNWFPESEQDGQFEVYEEGQNQGANSQLEGSEQDRQFESDPEQEEGLDQAVDNFLQDSEQNGQAEIYEEEQQAGDMAETSSEGRQVTSTDRVPLLRNDIYDDDYLNPMSTQEVGELFEDFEETHNL